MIDTEDRMAWYAQAHIHEQQFVDTRLPALGMVGIINPAKATDVFAHDLMLTMQADLKSVRTPLFKARELFGIDPQYAVTFNVKDWNRYTDLYPNIVVVFDVDWKDTSKVIGGITYRVQPMQATYVGFLTDICCAIEVDGKHCIDYQRRVDDDTGNAKSSWVFNVSRLHKVG